MDPIVCCALGLCCPPFSAEQEDAFRKVLLAHLKDEKKAAHIASKLAHDLGKLSEKIAFLSKLDVPE